MRDNRAKRLIASGGRALGLSMTITDPFVAEVVGAAGFDFVLIDTEHGPIAIDQLQSMLIALRGSVSTVLVRPPANDHVSIKRILDLGAEGIVVPEVSSRAECAAAVRAAKYPPEGIRGFGPRRASRLEGGRQAYLARANDEVAVFVMIEHQDALDNLDQILTTPGLDGIVVGPADLAVSMGHILEPGHADVEKAIEQVLEACERHGCPFGIYAAAEASARKWVGRGAKLVTVGSDIQFVDQGLARARDLVTSLNAGGNK
jgi:2-keto-3-deoxy-L-rhamnonate aldolase RhmA